jgi:hypothetical protein
MLNQDEIIGTWKVIVDPPNPDEETFYAFSAQDDLTMTFRTKTGTQYILLTYKLEGNTLVTDQPSHPKIERASISIENNIMTVDYDGIITKLEKMVI